MGASYSTCCCHANPCTFLDQTLMDLEHRPLRIGMQVDEGIEEIMRMHTEDDVVIKSPNTVLCDLSDTKSLQNDLIQEQRAIKVGFPLLFRDRSVPLEKF
ncbi:hypothetical protein LINGRAHAP2_LOCUS1642 [Linum grandiflorum]